MVTLLLPGTRRLLRVALVAASALSVITCAEDPTGPAAGEGRLRMVAVLANSLVPPLSIDRVHVRVGRPDQASETIITVYDDTVRFSPDQNTLTLRDIRIPMSVESEDLRVDLELLAGATVMFAGSQVVTVTRGLVTPPTSITLFYAGPGANVATLVLAPRDTTIAPGATVDFRLDAFDSSGAAVPQYYASWSLTGGPAAGARINANGRLTAPGVADTFYVKAVNIPTNSADSTRVIVGQVTPPPPVAPTLISGGYEFTCEIRGATTYCWGDNGSGQLGDGTTTQRLIPTPVAGGHTFVSLSAGLEHACALTAQGQAWCWGYGGNGELGNGATTSSSVPVQVSGGLAFVQLATGDGYSCGITAQGAAWCWGANYTGSLGDGTTNNSAVPVAVSGGHSFVRITAAGEFDSSADHTCAIDASGAAWCWGDNSNGQLGDGTTTDRNAPVAVSGGLAFTEISTGATSACGIAQGGALYCWGSGVLGTPSNTPQPVAGGFTYTALDMGDGHVCAKTAAGWRCAGANGSGQLGDGTGQPQTTPVLPSGGFTFTSLTAGGSHTCGVTAGGTYCWGADSQGQLGMGTQGQGTLVPQAVSPPPASVVLQGGGTQTGAVSTALPTLVTVLVRGGTGTALPGVMVRFDITAGGGTIAGSSTYSSLTDDAGVATAAPWVLGPTAGANTMTATVEALGVTGNPVT
ncbi:MAG TPA: hypothetical protein VHA75_04495, partial [Rugosimonospora sp.]|nr:hypothetical protein [Rugosimonospora sp.]